MSIDNSDPTGHDFVWEAEPQPASLSLQALGQVAVGTTLAKEIREATHAGSVVAFSPGWLVSALRRVARTSPPTQTPPQELPAMPLLGLEPLASPPVSECEQKLVGEFDALVSQLDLVTLAVPIPGRSIGRLESFRLVPVTSTSEHRNSYDSPGSSVNVPDGIRTTYGASRDRKPYLDAGQAVGLVYGDALVAVASACIDRKDRLKIVQVQDVTGQRKENGDREFFKTGLHNGMLWRDTLVRAWEAIGDRIGAANVVIQSNKNNTWPTVQKAGDKGYNDLARRMGYQLERTGDWVKLAIPEAS